jgi:hypothetical protein
MKKLIGLLAVAVFAVTCAFTTSKHSTLNSFYRLASISSGKYFISSTTSVGQPGVDFKCDVSSATCTVEVLNTAVIQDPTGTPYFNSADVISSSTGDFKTLP